MIIKELVLKISSVCNLNCEYCHVFNKSNSSYKNEPAFLSEDIAVLILKRIDDYCKKYSIDNFLIIFHGGEPLIIGQKWFVFFISKAKEIVKSTTLSYDLQTNGTLIDENWATLLKDLNINVGISIDGTKKSNEHRIYRSSGKEAYYDVLKGIKLIKQKQKYISVLSVINVNETPQKSYEFYKMNGINRFDLLLPDMTCDDEKPSIGEWVITYFDLWFYDNDKDKPEVRFFNTLINLILGNKDAGNDVWGRKMLGVVVIKTSGKIELVDSMNTIKEPSLNTDFHITENTFDDINNSAIFNKYYMAHQDDELSDKCKGCIIKDICGGGLLSHRYSMKNKFNNPSCYCDDIIKIVIHIQNVLYDRFNLSKYNCEKLTELDFL